MSTSENSKDKTLQMIGGINAVEGFDPTKLAVDYTDLNTGETRKRLPVMAQIAWFRLKYPEGRISVTAQPTKDGFVATARVYMHHDDPMDCCLAEATASRGACQEKPTVSPREWAQTAAVGIALRNAGFGLQFHAAGESFDEPAFDELAGSADASTTAEESDEAKPTTEESADEPAAESVKEPEPLTLDAAQKLPCPIAKYKDKTLGDLIMQDPKALTWVATKFTGDPQLIEGAKLICEEALKITA